MAELNKIQAVFKVEAHKKTILLLYSYVLLVSVSKTSTPVAFFLSWSYKTCVTKEYGLTVRLPVFIAAGKVEDCVLKYPPKGQPSQQRFLNSHFVLPGIAAVRFATLPIIR
ncbi:hypothetical protein D3C85_1089980 [compost metagenome]